MAGGTGPGYGPGEGDLQGGVGVGMAFQAISQTEMGRPLVTTVAGGNNIFVPRWMADMTILTGEFVAMGHAIAPQGGDGSRMTFAAILQCEQG